MFRLVNGTSWRYVIRRAVAPRTGLLFFVDLGVGALLLAIFWTQNPELTVAAQRVVVGFIAAAVYLACIILRWRYPRIAVGGALAATGSGWVMGATSDPMIGVAWCMYPLALLPGTRVRTAGIVLVSAVVLVSVAHGSDSTQSGFGQAMVVAIIAIAGAWLLGQTEVRRMQVVREAAERESAYNRASEQAAMAREVHDVVGHALSVISAEADVTRRLKGLAECELRSSLADIEKHARRALEEVQGLVRRMRGDVAPLGQKTTLQDLVSAAERSGLSVTLRVSILHVPGPVEHVAIRVIQEALSNVLRHAKATSCEIAMSQNSSGIVVQLDDDGVGLQGVPLAGAGLVGMRERVAEVGGSLSVDNRLEGGTRVLARIPVQENV